VSASVCHPWSILWPSVPRGPSLHVHPSLFLVRNDEDMTPLDMTFDYKVSSFLCLRNDKTKNLLLPNVGISNVLRNKVMMIEYGVQAHQSLLFVSSVVQQCYIGKAITHSSRMWLRSMSTWLKAYLISRFGPTLISCWQGLQIIKTCILCFCREQRCDHRLVIHPWDPGPSSSTPQGDDEHLRDVQGHPPPWPPP
jgi:hypothetical protein